MKQITTIPAANPGTDLKFRVTTSKDDFNLARDDFNIVIKNQYGRVVVRILKNDCFYDSEGRWYFNVENIKEGEHTAVFVGCYEDEDYDKQRRIWTDRQLLFVGREGCMETHRRHLHPESCPVRYEQVWVVSVDGEDYLTDCDGNYVYTAEGYRIQFSNDISEIVENMGKVKMKMKGDEFLKLMEGKEPNEQVNTIPELMDVMRGISDDTTVIDEIEDIQDENEASDEDIDEIFEQEQTGGSGGFPDEMQEEEGD